jgi:hypothetical protein
METGGIPVYVHIASLSPESSSETRGEAFIVVGERAFGMRMGLTPKALVAVAVLPHRRDVSKDLHRTHIKLRSDSSARRYVRLGNTCARGPTSQRHEGASARLDAPRTVSRRGSRFVGFIRRASAGPSPTCVRPVAGIPGTALASSTTLLYGGTQRVFSCSCSALEMEATDHARHFGASYSAGCAVVCRGRTRALWTRAQCECMSRFCAVSIDAFRMTHAHHEHWCTLEQGVKTSIEVSWVPETGQAEFTRLWQTPQCEAIGL